ncbi:MAG: TIGR03086 family metal-binding protein [Acidimicrobiia bacterium]
MVDHADRYRRAADGFGARVDRVPADGWDAPTPCAGWVARDIVTHLVGWVPPVFERGGVHFGTLPDAADDPVGAWHALDSALRTALADPAVAAHEFDVGPPGTMTVAAAVDMIVVGDLLVHTWDLARAAGLDEHLDTELVHEMVQGLAQMGDALEQSGHYAARVEVPADADEQTVLLALTGRRSQD